MEKLILVLAVTLALPVWAQKKTLSKFVEPANLCPVHPEEYTKALNKLKSFKDSLKKAPECQTLEQNLQNVEEAYSEEDYKRIKGLIQNKDGRAKELSPEEVEEVRLYAQKVSGTVSGFIELFSSNKKCLEKEKRPSLLSSIASVVQTTTNLVGKATGPGGIPLQVGGGLFAGVLSGIDSFISKGNGYKFSKKAEHRQLFATQLCIYNDIRTDAVGLINPERRIQFLKEIFQKQYLVAKYKYLTDQYPVCKQLSNYYYQTNFYMRDINKLQNWVEAVRDSNDSEYDKCLEINAQVHTDSKSAFAQLKGSVNRYPFGYEEIQQMQSGSARAVDSYSDSSATSSTLEWIDHVRRTNAAAPDLDNLTDARVVRSADGTVTEVVVVQEAAEMVASPYHVPYSWEQGYIEAAKKTAEKVTEAVEVDPFLCDDQSVQRANTDALESIEQYISLLRKNSVRVLDDLRDEANRSDNVFGESVGDFLLTTISKHGWAKDEIKRLEDLSGPGSSGGKFELRAAVDQLDKRLFGVLAPDYLDFFIEEGRDATEDYREARSDWLKEMNPQRGEMLFRDHLGGILASVPAEDYATHAMYYASVEKVAKPLEKALFAMNSVNEYCHFFAISGTYFPEVASMCASKDYRKLISRIQSFEPDIKAIHGFVAYEKQNIGIASGWSHVLLRKIENWFNFRGVEMQSLLD